MIRRRLGLAPPAEGNGLPTLSWWRTPDRSDGSGYVAYRGWLDSSLGLRLHCGFDGWQAPVRDLPLKPVGEGVSVAHVPDLDDHLTVDAVVTDGERWDHNYGADYRLWIGLDPVDSHLHASGEGLGERRSEALRAAMRSAGVSSGVVSWRDNRFIDWLLSSSPHLRGLVWVRPNRTRPDDVARRLDRGYVGLKLHPSFDRFAADDRRLDRFVALAEERDRPVAIHSAPGRSDPDLIRNLAERFPEVRFVLYHTYLGPADGRHRATHHAKEAANLILETSWCASDEVCRLVDEVGPERVMFGSDAAVDGEHHYVRQPPNVEGRETYNDGMVALARALGPDVSRQVFTDNARRLFRLTAPQRDEGAL
jgi:predicted TIM-barrel fold metal-dependent hydrolase